MGEDSKMNEIVSKILSGNRVTIPDELMKLYDLKEGDPIILDDSPFGITINGATLAKKPKPNWCQFCHKDQNLGPNVCNCTDELMN